MTEVDWKNGDVRWEILRLQLEKAVDSLDFNDLDTSPEQVCFELKIKRYPQGIAVDWQRRGDESEAGNTFVPWDELKIENKEE